MPQRGAVDNERENAQTQEEWEKRGKGKNVTKGYHKLDPLAVQGPVRSSLWGISKLDMTSVCTAAARDVAAAWSV